MAALTAVGAQLRIPLPYVPLTLQPACVCLAGLLLGPWRGAASQLVYLTVGLVGFPVFAGGGGPQTVLAPTFGYLLGFVGGAWCAGRVAGAAPTWWRALLAAWSGMAAIYLVGIVGLYLNLRFVAASAGAARHALELGLAPLPKDLFLGLVAAGAAVRLRGRLAGHEPGAPPSG